MPPDDPPPHYPPPRHRFGLEPLSEAQARDLAELRRTGGFPDQPLPDHIRKAVTVADETADLVRLCGPEEELWFPTPVPRPNWFQMARGYRRHMLFKYECPGFLAVEPGDSVVDCGAFVGAFALAAVMRGAGRVIAVEPAPVNHRALALNVEGSGIERIEAALAAQEGRVTLHLHRNPMDCTLLAQDQPVGLAEVAAVDLPGLMRRAGLARIDFLKLEAEGAEPEVAAQLHPAIVRKVAIDAGPERLGQSPLLDLAVMLANRGYRLASRNHWLYAKGEDDQGAPS